MTKRGYVELMGTVRETPISFKEVKKRRSPRKNAKKAEKISQKSSDNVMVNSDSDRVPFMIKMRKNPRDANPVRMRFPDHGSIPSRPFL